MVVVRWSVKRGSQAYIYPFIPSSWNYIPFSLYLKTTVLWTTKRLSEVEYNIAIMDNIWEGLYFPFWWVTDVSAKSVIFITLLPLMRTTRFCVGVFNRCRMHRKTSYCNEVNIAVILISPFYQPIFDQMIYSNYFRSLCTVFHNTRTDEIVELAIHQSLRTKRSEVTTVYQMVLMFKMCSAATT